jgi:3-phenylpropionate/trans-cinnamate dioxygenase ferredoxin reductase subunit
VQNAIEQAEHAAAAMLGASEHYKPVPWFWSDQYDVKLQIAGLADGAERQVVRGDPASAAFAVFHLKGDRIVSVEAVNAPAEFMGGRMMILKDTPVDEARLADLSTPMKAVAAG